MTNNYFIFSLKCNTQLANFTCMYEYIFLNVLCMYMRMYIFEVLELFLRLTIVKQKEISMFALNTFRDIR